VSFRSGSPHKPRIARSFFRILSRCGFKLPVVLCRAGISCVSCLCVTSAGELSEDNIEELKAIIGAPKVYGIPDFFLNRQKDMKTGKNLQLTAQQIDTKMREDLERMKKVRYVAMKVVACPRVFDHVVSI
jgi:hypothetical protein